jgi:hypothetical protein
VYRFPRPSGEQLMVNDADAATDVQQRRRLYSFLLQGIDE